MGQRPRPLLPQLVSSSWSNGGKKDLQYPRLFATVIAIAIVRLAEKNEKHARLQAVSSRRRASPPRTQICRLTDSVVRFPPLSGGDADKVELSEHLVVRGHLSLPLEGLDLDLALVVRGRREGLRVHSAQREGRTTRRQQTMDDTHTCTHDAEPEGWGGRLRGEARG